MLNTENFGDYITKIQFSEYDKIQNFEADLADDFYQFVILLGDNGLGKTLFLQLLVLALDRQVSGINIKIDVVLSEESIETTYTYSNIKDSHDFNEQLNVLLQRKPYNKIAAYGASRLALQTPESMELERIDIQNIFNSNAPLLNIEYWLKMKLLAEQEEVVRKVLELLASFMPNIINISYKKDIKKGVVFEYHTNNGIESIERLSAGHKGILALLGDMIIRLWDSQPDIKEISDLKGIVFIDEIEAHLHPNWQRKLPKLLADTFPKVQFIISTHTPMTLLGVPKNTALFHVGQESGQPVKIERLDIDIQNMTPQQILTSPLFGVESLRSLYNEKLEDHHTEENYEELLKRKEVQENIEKLYKNFTFKKPD